MIENTHEVELEGTRRPARPTGSPSRLRHLAIAAAAIIAIVVAAVVVVGFDDDSASEPLDTLPAPPPTMAPETTTPQPAIEPASTAPTPDSAVALATVPATELLLSGAATVAVDFGPVGDDKRVEYTAVASYLGDITGTVDIEGIEQYAPDDPVYTTTSTGTAVGSGTITIAGVGTGTLTFEDTWWSDADGHVIGESVITSADAELEGVTGVVRWNSTNNVATLSYHATFMVPG